jgi:hypothetical protein
MTSASALRLQIESILARRIPSALTPAPKMIRPVTATGIESLDDALQGGLPIGAVCEDRFNKNGESWILRYCFHGGPMNRFRLKDLLIATTPINFSAAGDVLSTAAAPEIQRDKIVYFAASVFWRGAISDWPWQGQTVPQMPLELSLRLSLEDYLLGNAPFPKTCSLLVYVAGDRTPPCNASPAKRELRAATRMPLLHSWFTLQPPAHRPRKRFITLLGPISPCLLIEGSELPTRGTDLEPEKLNGRGIRIP